MTPDTTASVPPGHTPMMQQYMGVISKLLSQINFL